VAVDFASDHGRLRIEFDLEQGDANSTETTLVDVRLSATGDPVIEALASEARDRTAFRVLADAGR
jgi:hypothetical protein